MTNFGVLGVGTHLSGRLLRFKSDSRGLSLTMDHYSPLHLRAPSLLHPSQAGLRFFPVSFNSILKSLKTHSPLTISFLSYPTCVPASLLIAYFDSFWGAVQLNSTVETNDSNHNEFQL